MAFGLDDREPAPDAGMDAGSDHQKCGPFLYGDALRLGRQPSSTLDENGTPVLQPWSWDEAGAMCKQRGMNLAVA